LLQDRYGVVQPYRVARARRATGSEAPRPSQSRACVLSDQAPSLQDVLERACEEELAYLILDGTIITCDRLAGTTISRKGKEIDRDGSPMCSPGTSTI
jgi:hypothetical protein